MIPCRRAGAKGRAAPGWAAALAARPACGTALGKGRWAHFQDMSPAWGHQQCGCVCLPHGTTPGRCHNPALTRAPQTCPQLQESHFLHCFILAQPEIRGTNSVRVGKGTNPNQRMIWHPQSAPAAFSVETACPGSSSCPVGVTQPCHSDTTPLQIPTALPQRAVGDANPGRR